jgi:hypothetical protein
MGRFALIANEFAHGSIIDRPSAAQAQLSYGIRLISATAITAHEAADPPC